MNQIAKNYYIENTLFMTHKIFVPIFNISLTIQSDQFSRNRFRLVFWEVNCLELLDSSTITENLFLMSCLKFVSGFGLSFLNYFVSGPLNDK